MPSAAARAPLSEAQLAVSLARKSRRDHATQKTLVPVQQLGRDEISEREWVNINISGKGDLVRVMTWNMLAQCLVRASLKNDMDLNRAVTHLHNSSNCLKANQREGMLVAELIRHAPEIICLQEVDRLERILPPLHAATYKEAYATGFGKRHGCMILHRDSIFEKTHQQTVHYDDLEVRQAVDERERKGSSRKTNNIGLIVGLRRRDQPETGYVVATTHLFWHPAFAYERARQAGLLLREISRFQETHMLQRWTCIIAGDFNCTPTDATYSLLVGNPLSSQHIKELAASRVVHASVDASVSSKTVPSQEDDGDAGGEFNDPDRVITNSRLATSEDGLLSDDELQSLFWSYGLRSVYDEGQRVVPSEHYNIIGRRVEITPSRKGAYEPMWTSYTHYWKTTLDYIFILDPPNQRHEVSGFLKTHPTSILGEGLPLKGVCASDHTSLVGEIGISKLEYDTN